MLSPPICQHKKKQQIESIFNSVSRTQTKWITNISRSTRLVNQINKQVTKQVTYFGLFCKNKQKSDASEKRLKIKVIVEVVGTWKTTVIKKWSMCYKGMATLQGWRKAWVLTEGKQVVKITFFTYHQLFLFPCSPGLYFAYFSMGQPCTAVTSMGLAFHLSVAVLSNLWGLLENSFPWRWISPWACLHSLDLLSVKLLLCG